MTVVFARRCLLSTVYCLLHPLINSEGEHRILAPKLDNETEIAALGKLLPAQPGTQPTKFISIQIVDELPNQLRWRGVFGLDAVDPKPVQDIAPIEVLAHLETGATAGDAHVC